MRAASELRLDGPALLEVLEACAMGDGWGLTSAIPHHEGGTLLVLTRPGSRLTLGLQVRRRDDAAPAWRRTAHLDLISQP